MIHPRWFDYYNLKWDDYEVFTIPARTLLLPWRFEIFARLYYIGHRDDRHHLARKVYLDSLRSLVPSGKEYGKEKEKSSFKVHIKVFDQLIDVFQTSDFNPSVSIVPIGKDNVFLDGSHRISALAYFDKDVTVCRFNDVIGDRFTYSHFLERGMPRYTADVTAFEGVRWLPDLSVVCVWEEAAMPVFDKWDVFYRRDFNLGKKAYSRLRSKLDPSWDGQDAEYPSPRRVSFVFFIPSEAHPASLGADVSLVARLVLTWEGRRQWYRGTGTAFLLSRMVESLVDRVHSEAAFFHVWCSFYRSRFDNKYWIRFYNLVSPLWKKNRRG